MDININQALSGEGNNTVWPGACVLFSWGCYVLIYKLRIQLLQQGFGLELLVDLKTYILTTT